MALLSGAAVAAADTESGGSTGDTASVGSSGADGADRAGTDSGSESVTGHRQSRKAAEGTLLRQSSPGRGAEPAADDSADSDDTDVTDDSDVTDVSDDDPSDSGDSTEVTPVDEVVVADPEVTDDVVEVVENGAPAAPVASGGATPRAGPATAAPDARPDGAVAGAQSPNSWWDTLIRDLTYTFFNKAPTLSPTDNVEVAPGVFTGKLNGQSNNGLTLSYSIKEQPKLGTLIIDQETGTYTYTFDPADFDEDTTDSFVIGADNGEEARRPGLFGIVQLVMHNIAIGLGLSQRDTTESTFSVTARKVEEEIEVAVRGTGFYGNVSNKKYWAEQNYADNCMLMSILMIESQFTGILPTRALEEAIVAQAKFTPSVVDPSKMMYLGDGNEDGVKSEDAVALLQIRGNDAALKYFPNKDDDATFYDGLDALDFVSKWLLGGNGVIAGVNNQTIWDATDNEGTPGADRINANHGVVVIAVDTHNGKVYLNDPGVSGGKGLVVPLGAFMWAWQSESFETIAVERPLTQTGYAAHSDQLILVA
ncbi:hypothetical protein [Mycolicibacterium parafortuitum]|nr:hypothetical protein [Mycolicibacterium parafortuitum]ORB29714.1 hypothetical protein BST38_14360 [Mycolicibacterium parafortuitum]